MFGWGSLRRPSTTSGELIPVVRFSRPTTNSHVSHLSRVSLQDAKYERQSRRAVFPWEFHGLVSFWHFGCFPAWILFGDLRFSVTVPRTEELLGMFLFIFYGEICPDYLSEYGSFGIRDSISSIRFFMYGLSLSSFGKFYASACWLSFELDEYF